MKNNLPRTLQVILITLVIGGVLALAISGYLNPAISAATSPLVAVQRWFATRYQAVYEFFTVPRDVASLREQIASLEAENNLLKTRNIELEQSLQEAQVLSQLVGFARSRPENQYLAATVIGRDPSPFLHYVIIDHGSDDGLRYGMPVVTQQGLVGRIDAVISDAARVQLITDAGSIVNVRLKTANVEGQVSGSITGEVSLDMVPIDTQVDIGEVILTSGLGGTYPPNIFVGQVLSMESHQNALFQVGSVQPIVDFSSLSAVLVITNFKAVDIAPLVP